MTTTSVFKRLLPRTLLVIGMSALLYPISCATKKDKSADDNVDTRSKRGKEMETASVALSNDEQKKLDELRAEMEIGRNMAGRLLAFYGVYDSKKLKSYVNQVGAYVASYSEHPERRYMFEIIDTEEVNAFACPGGYILVTVGALRHAQNEAEMAAILAHEVAHVGRRHMFDTLKSMGDKELEETAKEAERNQNVPTSMLVRKRPEPEESMVGAMLARYLSSATGISVLSAAKAGMSIILEKGLGADLEYEADREGVRYAIQAGYEPEALNNFLCRLELHRKKNGDKAKCLSGSGTVAKDDDDILKKTHPSVPQRVANIDKVLLELKSEETVGASGEKRYERILKSIPPPKQKAAGKKADK